MKFLVNESLIRAAAKEYSHNWQPLITAEGGFRETLCAAIVDWVEAGVASELYAKRVSFVKSLFPNFYY